MNKILLHHHLGLGDHIICNGLVRFLSINTKIDLFCKDQNLNNILKYLKISFMVKLLKFVIKSCFCAYCNITRKYTFFLISLYSYILFVALEHFIYVDYKS